MSKQFYSVEFYKEHLERERATFERLVRFKEEVAPLIDDFLKSLTVKPRVMYIRATKYPKVLLNYAEKYVVVLFSQCKGVYKIKASVYGKVQYSWALESQFTSRDIKEFIQKYNELSLA